MSTAVHAPPFDAVVIGGGIAALWTLDALDEAGFAVALIEPTGLGHGQTLASQGIIHGGLKYTLRGLLNPSAEAISAMPERWRASLAGRMRPDLRAVRLASPATWLWRSEGLSSKLAMVGARVGLRTKPIEVTRGDRPGPLASTAGDVYRVDEPVLDIVSLVQAFRGRHESRMLHASVRSIERVAEAWRVEVVPAPLAVGQSGQLSARSIILAAGSGNAELRTLAGIRSPAMQLRPLHMTLVRGQLPELFGHCVDGSATRVTITTHRDRNGENVWQVGGQLAEEGVALTSSALIAQAQCELGAVLPGVDLASAEWSTYRVNRAEHATSSGLRPEDAQCLIDDGVITLWPTKLALAPRAAERAIEAIRLADVRASGPRTLDGPRPPLGTPPWETATWSRVRSRLP